MKLIVTSTFLFLSLISIVGFAQLKSNYAKGFEVGFKEGYCYNSKTVDCFYPMTPEAPLPRLNEDRENYTQGYNRGFQFGLDLKRSNDALNNSDANMNYQITKFNDYIQQNPIDVMVAVGMMKQKKYDTRKDWIQERINQLGELAKTLFSKEALPSNYDANSIRSKYWKTTVDYVNGIRAIDYADDYQFNSIRSNFSKIESYYYRSYNEIIKQSHSYEDNSIMSSSYKNSQVENKKSIETKAFSDILKDYYGEYSCIIQEYELIEDSYVIKSTKNGQIMLRNDIILFKNAEDFNYKMRNFLNEKLDNEGKRCIYSTEHGDITIDYDFKRVVFYDLDHKHYYVYVIKNRLESNTDKDNTYSVPSNRQAYSGTVEVYTCSAILDKPNQSSGKTIAQACDGKVKIISKVNDEFYKVEYKSTIGYILVGWIKD